MLSKIKYFMALTCVATIFTLYYGLKFSIYYGTGRNIMMAADKGTVLWNNATANDVAHAQGDVIDMDNIASRDTDQKKQNAPLKCPALPCGEDCYVETYVSNTSYSIHVGGQANTWTTRHHVLLLVLKPGLCQVADKSEFNLTSAFQSSALYKYVTSLPSGTMIAGIITPGNYSSSLNDMQKVFGSLPSKKNYMAKTFVHMRRHPGNHKEKELDIRTGAAKWGVSTYIGQPMNLSFDELSMVELEKRHPSMKADLGWSPPHCQPQSTIAIIIPFRDRESHLRIFLNNLIPFLQRQMLAFQIFIIDQVLPKMFNRALLMNVGYLEAKQRAPFDCYVFHDVDLLNEDACNLYTCADQPRHLYASADKFSYKLPYGSFFGGATIFDDQQMERMNGFPNMFYGWGGEDDSIGKRITLTKMKILRNHSYIGRYSTIKHGTDKDNPRSGRGFTQVLKMAEYYALDGLNTTVYSVAEESHHQLFNRLRVEYDGPDDMAAAKAYVNKKEAEFKQIFDQQKKQKLMKKLVSVNSTETAKTTKQYNGTQNTNLTNIYARNDNQYTSIDNWKINKL